jgi:Kef-type K+ transport system membrane component KefB/Trk K+ transport system NAD-binding subunit
MVADVFIEISIIVILATIISIVMRIIKQPLIIGYILTGIIVGPLFLDIMKSTEVIMIFAEMGVALLLFIVGLNLNPRIVKEVGFVSLVTGIGQVIFTTAIGIFICLFLGFSLITACYIAIALAFSSTIIIMKLLSDKNELDTLYGRIAIGFLLVQDIIAIFLLMVLPVAEITLASITFTILKGIGLLVILFSIGYHVFPKIDEFIAKSPELLFLFSISWCLAVSALFASLGLSIEIGSLLAGITLSMSPFHHEIISRVKPLRDFFIVIFFILLGSKMVFENISAYFLPALIFSLFVLIGNPMIVMGLMGLMRYTKRNSFLAGLAVAQISEFSLIIVDLGVKIGHLTSEILSLVTLVGLLTMGCSTYMILYSSKLYSLIANYLSIFERRGKKIDEYVHKRDKYDVILFGYDRVGFDILESLKRTKKKFLVVDYNPEIIMKLAKEKIPCRYGDANDVELLNDLNFERVKMIISTIPDIDTNLLLINKIREVNKKAIVIVVSHRIDEALELYEAGATYVLLPHFLGGKHVATLIESYGFSLNKFLKEQIKHINHLKRRKLIGHEHPKYEKK